MTYLSHYTFAGNLMIEILSQVFHKEISLPITCIEQVKTLCFMLSFMSAKYGKMQNILRSGQILFLHRNFIAVTVHNIATGGSV